MKSIAADIIQTIRRTEDLDLSRLDDSFLLQMIKRRCELIPISDISTYPARLEQDGAERQLLLLSLNNNFTEFFRNSLTFAHLEHWVLPNLIDRIPQGRELRIWSAGCSTGQEPYSLAILLENLCEKRQQPFRYRIFATDISATALAAASTGEYAQEAVQNIRLKDLNCFFSYANGCYAVSERLKNHISFSYYDLVDPLSSNPKESIFGNFDLILCSNVLLYYNAASQRLILQKLINSMVDSGYLITGEAERSITGRCSAVSAVCPPSSIYRKKTEVRYETKQP